MVGGRAQVRDRGRLQGRRELGPHQNSAAVSNTGGCISQSRLGPQSSELQSSWEAPGGLGCQDMSGSTGGADHTLKPRFLKLGELLCPYFLLSFCKTSIQQILLHKMLMYRIWLLWY